MEIGLNNWGKKKDKIIAVFVKRVRGKHLLAGVIGTFEMLMVRGIRTPL